MAHEVLPQNLTGTAYKQNLSFKKYKSRDLNQSLLKAIPQDTPSAGQYDENSITHKYRRDDIQVPNLKLYTPKKIGNTYTKQANYYKNAPFDSYDPLTAFDSQINGITSSAHKKPINRAIMDKYNGRDDSMYNTLDFSRNIELENTKEERAE